MTQDRAHTIAEKTVSPGDKLFTIHLLCLMLFVFMFSSCAAPAPIETGVRNEKSQDLDLKTVLKGPSGYKGETVIWGGVIFRSEKKNGLTFLFVEETPFDFRGRPKDLEFSEGLFIAAASEDLDPKSYTAGRKITVAGEIAGEELGVYRNAPYVYPVLRVREIHLWTVDPAPIQWNWGRIPYYWPDEYTPDQERRPTP